MGDGEWDAHRALVMVAAGTVLRQDGGRGLSRKKGQKSEGRVLETRQAFSRTVPVCRERKSLVLREVLGLLKITHGLLRVVQPPRGDGQHPMGGERSS